MTSSLIVLGYSKGDGSGTAVVIVINWYYYILLLLLIIYSVRECLTRQDLGKSNSIPTLDGHRESLE